MDNFEDLWFDCESAGDGVTSIEQCACEKDCANFLVPFDSYSEAQIEKFRAGLLINEDNEIRLLRAAHVKYLTNGLGVLNAGFVSLDSSRPWICYWVLHGLYLLGKEPENLYSMIVSTLGAMQSVSLRDQDGEDQNEGDSHGEQLNQNDESRELGKKGTDKKLAGAYGGGPNQLPHCAPTYAAVLSLCIIGSKEALSSIKRVSIYRFFLQRKDPCGGFRIHRDGEVDSRATYTGIYMRILFSVNKFIQIIHMNIDIYI
jgi:protein farnesyltransferase subunit beta